MARWAVLRHNHKNSNKILTTIDFFVLHNLNKGTTLCYECLGEVYHGIVEQVDTEPNGQYDNLVLLNNQHFKYKTINEIAAYATELSDRFLLPNGKLIISFSHRFTVYDRVNLSIQSMQEQFIQQFKTFTLFKSMNLLKKSNPGYGDYFFCLVKNA